MNVLQYFHAKTKIFADKMTCVEQRDVYEKKAVWERVFEGELNIDLHFSAFGKIVLAWLKH